MSGWVGRPLLRREDPPLLRGEAAYVDDLALPGMAHTVVVRSPLAHARLGQVETAAARRAAGVLAVLTAADLAGRLGPMPLNPLEGAELAEVPIPLLAGGRVRFAGEPVAVVAAESRAAAEDAAALVSVDYDPLPVLVDPHAALASPVRLHQQAKGNLLLRWTRRHGDVDGAFRAAHRVVGGRFRMPRLVAAPIEVRGAVADYDAAGDLLTVWLSAQDPHRPLRHLAAVLRRPPERTRVVVRDVGGAFGSKGALAPEAALAAVLAMRLGRPVKWVEDRSENFLGAYQGRGQEIQAELAVDASGRFLALRARVLADLGAYLYPITAAPPVTTAMLLTGAYDVPAVDVEVLGVATNKVPTGPYRGAGRPEGAYVAERLADLAAAELGADPADLRRHNFIPPERFPHTTALGFTYDSGDYRRALDRACQLLGYGERRRQQAAARSAGRLLGIGLCVFVERAGAGLWERGSVAVGPDGRVLVRTGSTSHGQGHQTTFAQIAADALGLAPEAVTVEAGDTRTVPEGMGTYASRSVTTGGSAVHLAARQVGEQAVRVAAALLGVAPDDVRLRDGALVASGGRSLTLAEVAAAAADPSRLPAGLPPGLEAGVRFQLPGPVFPFGAYAAVVEIDRETGRLQVHSLVGVDDGGRVVNPLLAEGQVRGSAVQGLGQALFEEAVHDDQGQLLTGSLTVYGLPSAVEATPVHSELQETPSPFTPLGVKGLGESGAIAVPAVIANAVADALAPLGIRHLDPPYTPERLWRALGRQPDTHHPKQRCV
jgi:aerobic carbon-monoxide dehydrogenase large subunit